MLLEDLKPLLNLIHPNDNENGVHDASFGSMLTKADSMTKEEDPSINTNECNIKVRMSALSCQ